MSGAVPMKRAVAWGLLRSGALTLHRSRFEKGRAILLVYHRVNDEGDPFFPALPRRQFAAQLDYVAAQYAVEPLEDVFGWLRSGARGRPRVAITIDDGYPDTLDVVLPELERRRLPATLFLSTGPPETGAPLWIERVRWTVKHARARVLELPSLGIRGVLDGRADRLALLGRLLRRLKGFGPAEVDAAVEALDRALDPVGPPLPVLSWDGVRRLVAGAIQLGGHTHRHYMLSRLDDATLASEIGRSLDLIRQRTDTRALTFAYPNGEAADYDSRAVAVLRRLGATCAVTCRNGLARPEDDPFQLPRLYTTAPSLALFAARLAGLGREEVPHLEVS
jgi:peptidoglycan/xylan/chitin deacetylase (PgdA/CDA1 family)